MAYQLPFDGLQGAGMPARGRARAAALDEPMTFDHRLQLTLRRRRSERFRELVASAAWVAGSAAILFLGTVGVLGLR